MTREPLSRDAEAGAVIMVLDRARDYLTFQLDAARFAVAVEQVDEVLRAAAITAVANMPAIVLGLLDLRGSPLPVLDIRRRFGFADVPAQLTDHFLVVRVPGRRVVLRVDRALGLLSLTDEAIEPVAALLPGAERLIGVTGQPDGIILIHDLAKFLTATEAAALAEFDLARAG